MYGVRGRMNGWRAQNLFLNRKYRHVYNIFVGKFLVLNAVTRNCANSIPVLFFFLDFIFSYQKYTQFLISIYLYIITRISSALSVANGINSKTRNSHTMKMKRKWTKRNETKTKHKQRNMAEEKWWTRHSNSDYSESRSQSQSHK